MDRAFDRLRGRMEELKDLSGVIGLCTWDQETMLPARASAARGQQLSTLQGLYHERLVDPAVGEWLGLAEAQGGLSGDEQAMLRVFRVERDRAVKVPASLVRALAEAQAAGVSAWRAARGANDFSLFRDALGRLLELRRQQADALGHDGERYDALLEAYEPGMKVARLRPVLDGLRERLLPLVAALADRVAWPDALGGKVFEEGKQWGFTLRLLEDMRFDLGAGRQDKSVHPFTGGTHPLDVRLTTRLFADNLCSGIFSTIHEGGHGLYEQGFDPAHHRTPLAAAPSMGLHESQSRLWENVIGRSRPFWSHYFPVLQGLFADALGGVGLDDFHRSINRVSRSLVRVESDEVTYNLHIALRFELELLLIDDALPLDDLPSAWNDRMEKYLGVRPRSDLEGVLQDIHWAWGELGYFPSYTLGNLYAAQLYDALVAEDPGVEDAIAKGQLGGVREWLREKIHRQGYRLPAEERVQAVCGQGLTDEPFIRYLKVKYGALTGAALG
jgi:carboxypeptidase Taq